MGFLSNLLTTEQPNIYSSVEFPNPSDWDSGKNHNSATLHDKEKIKYIVDSKDNVRDLLEICTTNDNPYFRSAAMRNAICLLQGKDSNLISKDDIETLKLIIEKDDNDWVYFDAMGYLLNTKKKRNIDFLKEIAVTNSSPKKRFLALFQMITLSKRGSHFEIPHFIKERVLIDESNFLRKETVSSILGMHYHSRPHDPDLTKFAIQWVKYTATENQMGAKGHRIKEEPKDNDYFSGEKRDLLLI